MEVESDAGKKIRSEKSVKIFHGIYICLIIGVLLVISIVMLVFTRPIESRVEKRALTEKPQYTFMKFLTAEYMDEMSLWFSDTYPLRERNTELYRRVKDAIRLHTTNNDAVSVINNLTIQKEDDEPMRKAQRGIILVGRSPNIRAMVTYAGVGGGQQYANAINNYAKAMPNVTVYSMIVPSATDFYIPKKAGDVTKPQSTTIESVHAKLAPSVKDIQIYNTLKAHSGEDIYLRTDHHWSPLGAYYAAKVFANQAEVRFPTLESGAYSKHVITGFVGSMYNYSGDEEVKRSPEEFVYWAPAQLEYRTYYTQYKVDKHEKIIGRTPQFESSFFKTFKNGSGQAYSTFMGSDRLLTVVKTNTDTPRRLLIIKDSFGNAIPGYLFYSFNEIHVIDFRYFPDNVTRYCAKNGITDLLFVFNVFNVYNPVVGDKLNRFLR